MPKRPWPGLTAPSKWACGEMPCKKMRGHRSRVGENNLNNCHRILQNTLTIITFVIMLGGCHIDSQYTILVIGEGNSLVYNNLINRGGALSFRAVRHHRILL